MTPDPGPILQPGTIQLNSPVSNLSESPPSMLVTPGLVSVLVPCCGQLEYTRLCVPSLLRPTFSPYELIFLDIGSLDGTAEYLAGVAAATTLRVEIVGAVTDMEIPAVCQEALARTRGEFLVLLNNDTIVTDSWLDQLVSLANASPAIGMAGPMSNYAAPPQLVEAVPYRLGLTKHSRPYSRWSREDILAEIAIVDRFAQEFRTQHQSQWMEVERLAGFCVLIKREVLTHIGPLPTASGLSVFDTGMLCQKVRQSGYTLACCRDLFIHHFGSRTFAHGAPATTPAG